MINVKSIYIIVIFSKSVLNLHSTFSEQIKEQIFIF